MDKIQAVLKGGSVEGCRDIDRKLFTIEMDRVNAAKFAQYVLQYLEVINY